MSGYPKILSFACALVALVCVLVVAPSRGDAARASSSSISASALASEKPWQVFPGGLYKQADSRAAEAAAALTLQGRTADASAALTIASHPVAIWLGDWYQGAKLSAYISKNLAAAAEQGTTAVFVTYAIPNRDCGAGYSVGGLTPSSYSSWNQTIADTLAGHHAVVLMEPDSIDTLGKCPDQAATRLPLLAKAVHQFQAAGIPAYLDGGISNYVAPAVMVQRLKSAGVADARGFFTNVANYNAVTPERQYAGKLSALLGGKNFVIDVSRNGRGNRGTWCNAPGAGLGQNPHVTSGSGKLDALLWVKSPGLSDGPCNGGPAAGQWFASYARSLVAWRS